MKPLAEKMKNTKGFTLIELIVVIAVFSIIFGFVTVNLLGSYRKASLISSLDTLISDIKSQQIKAMVGHKEENILSNNYGIHFENNKYVLFEGSSSPGMNDFEVKLPDNLEFSNISFPDSNIVFQKGNGEVVNFTTGQSSLIIRDTSGTEQKTITLNKYGIIISVN